MTTWISQLLTADHIVDHFACGQSRLDEWLRLLALRAQRSGTARTYVWTGADDQLVRAYYAVAPTQVVRQDVPRPMTGGVEVVPAFLLARLALDRTLHRQGLGSELLLDALQVIVAASESAGGRLIIVDAIDEAAARFYRRHDFQVIKGTRRLAMKVSTAREALNL